MTSRDPIVIAGGGVGGLSAALALAQIDRACLVLERAPAFREVGAGLQLAPNACRILRDWGVLELLDGAAVAPQMVRIRRGTDGADLARLSLENSEQRWGAPYLNVHRADLLSALLQQAQKSPLIEIRTDATLTGFIEDERGVAVTYRDNDDFRRAAGEALIGADGLRSVVRSRLLGDENDRPVYTGHTAWRTLLPADGLPEAMRRPASNLWLGDRAHLVHYPLRGGQVVNVVALVEDSWRGDGEAGDFWNNQGDRKFLLNRFRNWTREALDLIGAGDNWLRWPLFDRPPIDPWARGRTAVLGDAAHPMLPYLAQGAAQAIEDARALAGAVKARPKDAAGALAEYSSARKARAGRIQQASRDQGEIYHLSGFKAFARDLVMRASGPDRLLRRQNWIYSA
ncbi:FAD-dependent monooxygenase [uncultured Rhodoblastus sp.]|uniref:FAD-dependent monooxygenase n=1 Tax=uncultured Rhodoblastus sp. TaxID=543037 RepID=UPI0025F662C2|nr:FAD-dependent monooxygenase [uncultured Rhodoblastus sp.]